LQKTEKRRKERTDGYKKEDKKKTNDIHNYRLHAAETLSLFGKLQQRNIWRGKGKEKRDEKQSKKTKKRRIGRTERYKKEDRNENKARHS
jgi:hypothetical protein